jgi:hypothetical protein
MKEKNNQQNPKKGKIVKNAKSRLKVPKIGPSVSFERFLGVFLPFMSKNGSQDTYI